MVSSSKISIRTPAWGVTRYDFAVLLRIDDFNSHPRVGGDSKNTQNSMQPFVHLRCFMRLLF